MEAQKNCTCGAVMHYCGRQNLHMNGKPCLMELTTYFRPVDLYVCPNCHRLALYAPDTGEGIMSEEEATMLYGQATVQELRDILADEGYTPQIRAAARQLLQEKG